MKVLVIVTAIVLGLLCGNALAFRSVRAARSTETQLRREQTDVSAQVAKSTGQLEQARRRLARATAQLARRTANRDALQRLNASTRTLATHVAAEVEAELAGIYAASARAGSLTECLTRLQGAMNALAVGDSASGIIELAHVEPTCAAAAG